jgi:hypothetical protein
MPCSYYPRVKIALTSLAMICMGCGVDTAVPGTTGDDGTGSDTGDPGDGTGPVTEVSGRISASTTWKDTVHMVGAVTIDPGVTVTVAPGTTIDLASNVDTPVGITAQGVLDIQGTKARKVVLRPATAGESWGTISVPRGGTMTASYLVQTGGKLGISSTGKVTLVDTQMSHAPGDLITMSGGTLTMTYSAIGLDLGQRDTTHCDLHVSGPVTITATHSNFSTSSYGIMFYGGNADFKYTNWFGNAIDVDTLAADPVTGDFSFSYFANGAPGNAGFTMNDLASGRVADAGVR